MNRMCVSCIFDLITFCFRLCRTTVLQSMKLGVDVNRHKEIIVKAISAILLLLLKHFKLNHVYQVITFLKLRSLHKKGTMKELSINSQLFCVLELS